MRISAEQIYAIQRKFDFAALPNGHESLPQLEEAFGSHTFFLNDNGLLILEEEEQACEENPMARLIVIALWEEEDDSQLLVQTPPVATDVVINLKTGDASKRHRGRVGTQG